jgi:hypothetical protein
LTDASDGAKIAGMLAMQVRGDDVLRQGGLQELRVSSRAELMARAIER